MERLNDCKTSVEPGVTKDFANYKDKGLEIYRLMCTPVQLYFDVIGYLGCLRV